MKLKNQTAVITGGATGIGLACAKLFHKEGAKIVLFGRRAERLEVSSHLLGSNVSTVTGDITKKRDVENLVEKTLSQFGHLDILINNAGVFTRTPFHETDDTQWDSVLDTNLKGVFLLTRLAIPHMLHRKKGVIVNVSSILGIQAASQVSAYNVSKGALNQFTKSIAVEYGSHGIRCNAVCPGLIATEMTKGIMNDPKLMAEWRKNYPLGHFGSPEDVANACLFLASDDSAFITGVLLPIDGGYSALARG